MSFFSFATCSVFLVSGFFVKPSIASELTDLFGTEKSSQTSSFKDLFTLQDEHANNAYVIGEEIEVPTSYKREHDFLEFKLKLERHPGLMTNNNIKSAENVSDMLFILLSEINKAHKLEAIPYQGPVDLELNRLNALLLLASNKITLTQEEVAEIRLLQQNQAEKSSKENIKDKKLYEIFASSVFDTTVTTVVDDYGVVTLGVKSISLYEDPAVFATAPANDPKITEIFTKKRKTSDSDSKVLKNSVSSSEIIATVTAHSVFKSFADYSNFSTFFADVFCSLEDNLIAKIDGQLYRL
ncbi:MAG TPA: hypothetical protein VI959_00070, partial [Alphaproteobacteria bacterium]|nr:hypothetical protein [Alphaproteobacteria bacterium]